MAHSIWFDVDADIDDRGQAGPALVPVVDGRRLDDLVEEYERRQGFGTVGGYAGVVLDRSTTGNPVLYYEGRQEPWPGRVPLLVCDRGDGGDRGDRDERDERGERGERGEFGRTPLVATVEIGDEVVQWSAFEQPGRAGRGYSGFGPFVFARRDYDDAVNAVAEPTVVLWRPTGPEELALVEQSGWRAWPPRLPDQPIFYPVLNREYAAKIARDWNVPRSGAGFVTRFAVRKSFLDRYDVQQVGGQTILEYWIPAEDLEELNASIAGRIHVVEEFRRTS